MSEKRSPLLERPVIREQFRKELRGRLMSEAVVVLAKRPSRFTLPMILRPALATVAALVLVVAGATSAAASSLPGEALYGVKRAGEDVRLALTFDAEARTHLLAELTDRRLEELAEIAKRRPASAPTATQEYADAVEAFADAIDDLKAAANEDKRAAAQALAEAARAKHKAVLDAVKERLSGDDQSDVQKVIDREDERTSSDNPGRGDGSGGGRPSNVPARPTPRK
jgi:Xaa-Pro aminopeptidase